MSDFNADIVEEFRTHGGATRIFGDGLVLMHTIGAKSGAVRLHPVLGLPDGDGWLIAASKGGAPEHPAWFHNLVAHPEIDVEVPDGRGGIAVVPVRAVVLEGAARDAAWQRFVGSSPAFAQYERRAAGRVIPVVRLARR